MKLHTEERARMINIKLSEINYKIKKGENDRL